MSKGPYVKIYMRMHADAAVRSLSTGGPCGRTLWFHLLCGEQSDVIPGLDRISEIAFAENLRWPLAGFRKAHAELVAEGLTEADWNARLIWTPQVFLDNAPVNPNVVVRWNAHRRMLPGCALKDKACIEIGEMLGGMGEAYLQKWDPAAVHSSAYKIQSDVRARVKLRDGDLCRYCGIKVSWTERGKTRGTCDHVDPTGPGSASNVVVACGGCNSRKGFRTPEQAGMTLIQRH